MSATTEIEQVQERALEVKLILRRLIAEVEAAEVEAADTNWLDEKESIIQGAFNDVSSRCNKLWYDLTRHDTSETLLTKREAE